MGPLWRPLGALLRPSWSLLGAILEAIDHKGVSLINDPPSESETSPLGALLGPSWAPLGALLGHLGAILRLQNPAGSEETKKANNQANILLALEGVGPLGGVIGMLRGHSEPSWVDLGGPLGGMLEAVLNHLELSCAILEAIWSPLVAILGHLGRSNPSRSPPSRPRESG